MKNGIIWQDVDGNDIQAHGGCIMEHDGTYYWYGENKGQDNCPGTKRIDVIGISCYTSQDLVNWKYEGLVLESDKENPESYIHTSKVVERPKVVYNKKNKNYVMWMHIDSPDYSFAAVGVAVSKTPTGKFELLDVIHPNCQGANDMTVYVDKDDVAYLIHTKDWDSTLNVARLDENYTNVDGMVVSVMIDQFREAPAVFFEKDMYYMITSGCTGWDPNAALYSTCPHIMGKWRIIDNPCRGENAENTFFGQSTYVFTINGKHYLMLDHWQPYELKKSGYSILPIEITDDHRLVINWQEEWNGIEK